MLFPAIIEADGVGFEAVSTSGCDANGLLQPAKSGEAESEAVWPDPDLTAVVEVWATLPAAIKVGILAMLRAVVNDD
jgi:hypothetical protein